MRSQVLVLAALALASPLTAPPLAWAQPTPGVRLGRVVVAPFAIESQPLDAARPTPPQSVESSRFNRARLAEQVTRHVERYLRRRGAASLGRVLPGQAAPEGASLVSGEARLPLDEPALRDRMLASFRRGKKRSRERLATVRVTLQRPGGGLLVAEETILPRDVLLSRHLKNRAFTTRGLELLLELFAEKAADRALSRLLSETSATAANNPNR